MKEQKKKTLAQLLVRTQQGDRDALQALCKMLGSDIRGYFSQKFSDSNIVDDLAQETYIRLMRNLSNVREPMKLRSFVVKVAVHVSQDYLRQKYRKKEATLIDHAYGDNDSSANAIEIADQSAVPERVLDQMELESALDKLPQKARQILMMKADGYKYEEIADELGLSVSGVKMQVKRSFENLRTSLMHVTFMLLLATLLVRGGNECDA